MTKYYNITGLTVAMDSFGRTVTQAAPYECEPVDRPDIVVGGDWKRIKAMAEQLSDEDCEYLATGNSFYSQLLCHDGMMLHSSAVVMDGQAYLFSAPSGTGKSTHTALWRKVFGEDRALILNDDKPALRFENGRFYAYGTPWSGKTDQNLNLRVPLAGVCMLYRGEVNRIEPFSGPAAIHAILEQTVRPADPTKIGILLDLLDKLLTTVPIWKMHCNMDPEAARVSYAAMSAGRKERYL
ncbi:MAG: hypothetical protein IKB79_04090 [Oscillospiraceae bacterium]|nr:hypothetical protein [Oscillospiraceae bacterium]